MLFCMTIFSYPEPFLRKIIYKTFYFYFSKMVGGMKKIDQTILMDNRMVYNIFLKYFLIGEKLK